MGSLQTAHPPLVQAPPLATIPSATPALAVEDLHAAYGQSEVLHGLTFSVAPGEIVAVMGRNGMGKTTLMKTLMGLVPVKAGSIRVEGADVAGLKSHARVAKGLAYVPQGRMIFSTMTVQENIETGLTVTGTRKVPQDLYDMFPVLLEMKGRRGGNLSGGSSSSSPSPGRWRAARRSCSSTSPPRASSPRSSARWAGRSRRSATRAACPSWCPSRS